MIKIIAVVSIYFFTGICLLQAQQNRYVVYFTDKDNTPYTIDSPEQFLSPRALQRRADQDIEITEADLPVDPAYVAGLRNTGAEVFFTTKWLNGAVIQAEPALLNTIGTLDYVDSVAYAAPGERLTHDKASLRMSNRERLKAATDKQLTMLGIDALHEDDLLGQGMLVAFFDGGFAGTKMAEAFEHVYSSNRILYTFDLVENDHDVYEHSTHGTNVFSITAGLLTDVFEGSAYGADYMLFVTEEASTEYRIEEYNWLIAAEKADSAGVDIISSSLGYFTFDDPSMNYTYADMDGQTTVISRAASFAAERGILVVTSAGNEGNGAWRYITAPADAANIISVGSVDASGQISPFSSIGPSADGRIKPEVVALGSGTVLVEGNGNIDSGSGTSFSTPLITGLAAGLWQAYPHLTNLQLITLILESGDRAANPDFQYGYGLPDYEVIKSRLQEHLFVIYPNPVTDGALNITRNFGQESQVEATIYGTTGALLEKFKLRYSPVNDTQTISLDKLKAGIYFLSITADTVSLKFRIVKY